MPIFEIQTPDGETYEVDAPDQGTALESMGRFYDQNNAAPTPEAQGPALGSVADAFTQGITMGAGDELTALEAGILGRTPDGGWFDYSQGFGDRYDAALAAERAQQKKAAEDHPLTMMAAELTGAVSTGIGAGRAGINLGSRAGASLGSRIGKGAATGSGLGGVYGFNAGEGGFQNRAENAAITGAIGGGLGAALPVAGAGISRALTPSARKATIAGAPTNEQLRQTAKTAYQAADDAGLSFTDTGFSKLSSDINKAVRGIGYNPKINPPISGVLDEVKILEGSKPTLERIEQLRRIAQNAAKSTEPSDKAMGSLVIDTIDDFVGNIKPGDISTGSAANANKALKVARDAWRRMRKSEMIDEAIYTGRQAASGADNGIRNKFTAILNSAKKRKMFTPEEVKEIEKVANGTLPLNAAKFIGKFSPNLSTGTGIVGTGLGVGGAGFAGGVPGALAATAVSAGSRKASEMITRRNAEFVAALVRSGKIAETQAPAFLNRLNAGAATPGAIAGQAKNGSK